MKQTPTALDAMSFPAPLRPYLSGEVLDSSCSPEARVWFFPSRRLYLKRGEKGALAREAELDGYFFSRGLGPRVLLYLEQDGFDYLLTEAVRGEDATAAKYLAEPKRLCDLLASILRSLHEMKMQDCPVLNRTAEYLATAEEGYRIGRFDSSYLMPALRRMTADEAHGVLLAERHRLRTDTLLHGDFCLPNIMLDNWRPAGFIDLGNGGVGDRHVDLYWGAWTLAFNLGTDEYRSRFYDGYGRDAVDPSLIELVSVAEAFG